MALSKVVYEFDPFELAGLDKPSTKSDLRAALKEIADYVKTETLSYVGEGKSPVAGGSFKHSLSPAYKKIKEKISGADFANLELTGDMLDALETKITDDGMIQIGIWGKEAAKADGHNNFSGKSTLPAREFIPNENKSQTFKRDILSGIRGIAEAFLEDD
jgi:hypothetical protein